jgi:hypothetical protein
MHIPPSQLKRCMCHGHNTAWHMQRREQNVHWLCVVASSVPMANGSRRIVAQRRTAALETGIPKGQGRRSYARYTTRIGIRKPSLALDTPTAWSRCARGALLVPCTLLWMCRERDSWSPAGCTDIFSSPIRARVAAHASFYCCRVTFGSMSMPVGKTSSQSYILKDV